jgi:hypothetical protein
MKRSDKYAYRDELPFMNQKRGSGFWSVKPSGDYLRDYDTGREYALQFWKVCGKHGNMGLELSSILLGILEAKRPRIRRSGIEAGFLRTIGNLFQAAMYASVMVSAGPKRIAARDFPKARETSRKLKLAVGLVGTLANAMHCGTARPTTTN